MASVRLVFSFNGVARTPRHMGVMGWVGVVAVVGLTVDGLLNILLEVNVHFIPSGLGPV